MEKKRTGYKRYPSELKERAVRMVLDLQRSDPGDKSVISRVARQLGVGEESLRVWVKRAQIDAGTGPFHSKFRLVTKNFATLKENLIPFHCHRIFEVESVQSFVTI
jgi:transposase-like protein